MKIVKNLTLMMKPKMTTVSVTKENEIKKFQIHLKGFFLYYVIDVEVAPEMMVDDYNHIIEKGSMYLKCNYLEKKFEKKGNVFHKMLKKIVYAFPAQVVNPFVSLNDDLSISAAGYQWLFDI